MGLLLYLLNFLIILASIILFALPFFAWYYWRHRASLGKINYNVYLENFFSSPAANWLVFFWAFGEALVWFVIPEFLLLLVLFMRVRRKRQLLIYDIAGTASGIIAALLIKLPASAIDKLPYIQPRMVHETERWYSSSGILGLAHQPFSGVPFKVFTHLAWQYHFSFILFLITALFVRIFRYLVVYGMFLSLYPKLHKIVRQNYIWLSITSIFIFSVLLLEVYHRYA